MDQPNAQQDRPLARTTSFFVGMQNGVKQPWFAQLFAIIGAILFSFALFTLKTMYRFSQQNNWEATYAIGLFSTIFTLILMRVKKISAFDVPLQVRNRLAVSAASCAVGLSFFLASIHYLTLGRASLLLTIIPIFIGLLQPVFRSDKKQMRTNLLDIVSFLLMVVGLVFLLGPHLAGDEIGLKDNVDVRGLVLGLLGSLLLGTSFSQMRAYNQMQKNGIHYLIIIVYSFFITTLIVPAVMYPSMASNNSQVEGFSWGHFAGLLLNAIFMFLFFVSMGNAMTYERLDQIQCTLYLAPLICILLDVFVFKARLGNADIIAICLLIPFHAFVSLLRSFNKLG